MKESFYFPHDTTAHDDPKMSTLLIKCGMSGIGMYWTLIELLHQQEDGKITEEELGGYISWYCKGENKNEQVLNKIKQVLIETGLLQKKDGFIYSDRVLENKEIRKEISEARSLAGKKSAEKRRLQATSEQVFSKCATNVQQNSTKERKRKEKKRKEKKEIIISKDITTKVEFGNPEINKTLEGLKTIIGIDDFKETQTWQRRYGKHFLLLIKKLGKEEFRRRLAGILDEPFKAKNCNSLKYLYGEMKSFARVGSVASTDMPKFESI